jgi:DNA-binding CsgD family transcriptional regulator
MPKGAYNDLRMSAQPPITPGISVRDDAKVIPYNSRMGRYLRGARDGQPVRQVTTKIKKDEILRLLLINKNTREIAEDLKLSVHTVRDYIRDVDFQQELKKNSEVIWRRVDEELMLSKLSKTQRVAEMGDRALEVLEQLLDSEDERVQAKVASDILDRNPETSKHHHVESKSLNITLTSEDLLHAAQAAAEVDAAGRMKSVVPAPEAKAKDIDGVREGLPDGA